MKHIAAVFCLSAFSVLDATAFSEAKWISAVDETVFTGAVASDSRAQPGNSWFLREIVNEKDVVSAKWTTTALGVYEIYVNGGIVGNEFLKPGFTHVAKTRYSFSHDVTSLMKIKAGERNVFAAVICAEKGTSRHATSSTGR